MPKGQNTTLVSVKRNTLAELKARAHPGQSIDGVIRELLQKANGQPHPLLPPGYNEKPPEIKGEESK